MDRGINSEDLIEILFSIGFIRIALSLTMLGHTTLSMAFYGRNMAKLEAEELYVCDSLDHWGIGEVWLLNHFFEKFGINFKAELQASYMVSNFLKCSKHTVELDFQLGILGFGCIEHARAEQSKVVFTITVMIENPA